MAEYEKRQLIAQHLRAVNNTSDMNFALQAGKVYLIGYVAGYCSALDVQERTYLQFKRILLNRFKARATQ